MSEKEGCKDLREGRKSYDERVSKGLVRQPEMTETFTTVGGIPLERLYTPLDLEGMDYCRDIGFPGDYPYT
ncbi:MAG: methylmalonyl-CoA mutase, partial [Thermovirgaceae bacterium]|nr:methylmalonyl-CoA mutase [Thermovirgaceae bacterium]